MYVRPALALLPPPPNPDLTADLYPPGVMDTVVS
jgi:hypothetical protein